MVVLRILWSIALLVLAFLVPWWITTLLTLATLFYFKHFYEAVLIGLVLDALAGSYVLFPLFPYALTLCSLGLVVIVTHIRERMIMY